MIKKFKKIFYSIILFQSYLIFPDNFDLSIIGYSNFSDGLGRIAYGLIDHLRNDINISFIDSENPYKNENNLLNIPISKINNSPITVYIDSLSFFKKRFLNNNGINIAYSMFETTKIIDRWVTILNENFDAVVVPDKYLIEVYKNSGVKIPIFEIPLGMYLDDFFIKKRKNAPNNIFTFGCLATIDERKNQKLLIEAFYDAFGNSENVKLIIYGKSGNNSYLLDLKKIIEKNNSKNIEIFCQNLKWQDYINLMYSFDCYVNLSKGEGFSLGPREALALGIPCIISKNTAQITIAESEFVKYVPSDIEESADYFYRNKVGNFFCCNKQDVSNALLDIYINYNKYLNLAKKGRKWVRYYSWRNLKPIYLNLIKPKKIFLGNVNKITDNYLITDSEKLFIKYKQLNIEVKNGQ